MLLYADVPCNVPFKGGDKCRQAASEASVPWMKQNSGKSPARVARQHTKKGRRTSSPPRKRGRQGARAARPPVRIAPAWPRSAARAANTSKAGGNSPELPPYRLERADQLLDARLRERDVGQG